MQNITIDKDIPPPNQTKGFMPILRKMEIGDSIFVADRTTAQVSSPIAIVRRETGFKFTSRGLEGGCRIWRIA